MTHIYLSLVFHNHQPVGNFDFVFQNAFEQAYQPLTNALNRHPSIKVAMHFTGPLIDWLLQNQPQYLEQVAAQVERGQLEILSGAYYEPILTMLLDDDKIGQMQKLNATVERLFGFKPSGMWLAERIWEPHLPASIQKAGLEYTLIDDSHFIAAGFKPEELFGYFVTEDQGFSLKLVPTQTQFRNLIPWRPPHETIDWLREQAERGVSSNDTPMWAVMGDDGEKFGMWPQTYDYVWSEYWMDHFFEAIEANGDWLETIHPREYIQQHRANNIAYLPAESYTAMGQWALPSPESYLLRDLRESYEIQLEHLPEWDFEKRTEIEHVLRFLRGSFWRNFLVKYPEINHMQKRGLSLSKLAHLLPTDALREKVLDALWASQSNCGYWHGVFGGVYLFHIRSAIYTNLIRAEAMMDDRVGVWHDIVDFNADTNEEIFTGNGPLALVIEPNDGGMISEFDYRPIYYNLLNIMSRHPEGYHIQIQEAAATNMLMTPEDDPDTFEGEPILAKERGLENVIYVDWHRRGMFNDHFLGSETTAYLFESVQYPEQGNFVNQPYDYEITQSKNENIDIKLWRDGNVWLGEIHLPVRVEKTLRLNKDQSKITATYRVINNGNIALKTRFGVEMAFGFDGGDNEKYCQIEVNGGQFNLGQRHEFGNISSYKAITQIRQLSLDFQLQDPTTVWSFPLAPITLSEEGFERVHQGVVTMPIWNLTLQPGEAWQSEIELNITPLDSN